MLVAARKSKPTIVGGMQLIFLKISVVDIFPALKTSEKKPEAAEKKHASPVFIVRKNIRLALSWSVVLSEPEIGQPIVRKPTSTEISGRLRSAQEDLIKQVCGGLNDVGNGECLSIDETSDVLGELRQTHSSICFENETFRDVIYP